MRKYRITYTVVGIRRELAIVIRARDEESARKLFAREYEIPSKGDFKLTTICQYSERNPQLYYCGIMR